MALSRFPSPNTSISIADLPLDSEIRKIYPKTIYPNHNTVRLPFGTTGYHLFGSVHGIKVVLVHGISTPSIVWYRIAPFLADHGFRVLVYDLFGRGYSEAPSQEVQYTPDLYIMQLSLLMHHVGFAHAHIIGLSMLGCLSFSMLLKINLLQGGGIIAGLAALFPRLITEKLVFLASAGLMDPFSKLPGEPIVKPTTASLLEKLRVLQSACLPGFQHTLTSSFFHGPISGMEKAFETIAKTKHIRSLIIHGTKDNTVDLRFGQGIFEILGERSELFLLQEADHDFIIAEAYYEKARDKILEFLSERKI